MLLFRYESKSYRKFPYYFNFTSLSIISKLFSANLLYILIDKNLDPIYGAVQGGHAVADWVRYEYYKTSKDDEHNILWDWNNDYLIYLSVDINKWWRLLNEYGAKSFERFHEPDLGDKMTSIAVWEGGLPEVLKHKIEKEKLLK